MAKRELNIKPSCTSQILGFPPDRSDLLSYRLSQLFADPQPDGHTRIALKGHSGIYRLRFGRWRLLYTFGPTWIRLLSLRRRQEDTYRRSIPDADAPRHLPPAVEPDIDDLDPAPPAPAPPNPDPQPAPAPAAADPVPDPPAPPADPATPELPPDRALPVVLTPAWLSQLRIPAGFIPGLLRCHTEEDLLSTDLPGELLQRVIDNLYPQPVEEVLQQPDLVVSSPADLARFKDGSLVSFLLKLDASQERLTSWALRGPSLVRGGAGTGKSTVALYRVRVLLERQPAARVLFTTYTQALKNASHQLLGQLLGADRLRQVRVATCDQLAVEIVHRVYGEPQISTDRRRREILRTVRQGFLPAGGSSFDRKLRGRAIARLGDEYLLEEIDWIIEGRGIETLEQYLAADRRGRARRFSRKLREGVFELFEAFTRALASTGLRSWGQVRAQALAAVRSGRWHERFDFILVDEAQDLSPISMALMAELCATPEGIFFAADDKQSIYTRGGWQTIHPRLRFVGRTAVLRQNHRSTIELDCAAFSVLDPGEAPVASTGQRHGPRPLLVSGSPRDAEARRAATFIHQATRALRMKLDTAMVLVPTADIGKHLASHLYRLGIPAEYFQGRTLDLGAPVVKVMTLHAAKGLELPVVVLAGLWPGTYPESEAQPPDEGHLEALATHRRLLYVGMSRAMRALMVLRSIDCRDEILCGLDPSHWQLEEC